MFYIRHSYKAWANGKNPEYSLDPHLTENGRKHAHERFSELVRTYGAPSRIVSSPYRRTRETAAIAQSVVLSATGIYVPITYDTRLGEYLNPKYTHIHKHLTPETLALNPHPPCALSAYSDRLQQHIASTSESGWYITHGLTIELIASLKHNTHIDAPHEVHGIHSTDQALTLI